MRAPDVVVDISQFAREPAATGIQRVLAGLLRGLTDAEFSCCAGFLFDGVYHFVPLSTAYDAVTQVFVEEGRPERVAEAVWNRLVQAELAAVPADQVDLLVKLWFLPEPCFRADVLQFGEGLLDRRNATVAALVHDALPVLAPWLFSGRHQSETDAYFRFVASVRHRVATSDAVASDLQRLSPRSSEAALQARPGVEPTRRAGAVPNLDTFVCVGTVEPRKQYPLVLAAMRLLWAKGGKQRLVVIGRPGWESRELLDELELLDSRDPLVTWFKDAPDSLLTETLSTSAALLYMSRDEGYGLPPLEALAAGVPALTTQNLPALETLADEGHVRLNEVTPEALAREMLRISAPDVNARLRREASLMKLPSWQEFHDVLQPWLARLVDPACLASPGGASDGS